ncbi:phosphopyruvate hydratase [Candidatus Falkowbacteria bacterium]|jgi:enolase|nr:phosphopyruvate hydratase [Candidatus Falkowbacteria bacterium]MBT4433079.1 phosphopyruvate hydratase [Candidatus Falkowbacteria bacterium]
MSKFTIQKVSAREILDSRGNPTIEVRVDLPNKLSAKASVPSGASTGIHEALELRDKEKRYKGKGVLKAIKNVNISINRSLKGMDAREQEKIDKKLIKLDGTNNKKRLGANAILGASLACARAATTVKKQPLYDYINKSYKLQTTSYQLPIPMFNIFNGGKHADTNLDFQEFMVIPMPKKMNNKSGKKVFAENVRMGSEIFHELGRVLKERGLDTDVGNEGGYAPDICSSIQALDMIMAASTRAGYIPGVQVGLGTDVGSSVLYDKTKKKYIFRLDKAVFTNSTLTGLYHEWLREYPFVLIEDGLAEDDWEGWKELTHVLGNDLLLVGDDLFVTNKKRLQRGIKENVANSILIKPNQVGTLTETIECIKLAKKNDYKIIVSHRSGETTDDFIADLAVAAGADYIKAGAPNRGERVAKYNRLMEIEEELN